MLRRMFKSKIHRATVTQADLNYEGSLTIDEVLMQAADIIDGEEVHLWNVTRGTRLTTYAIRGEASSGVMCVNGAAAHLMNVGDIIIVATFVSVSDEETVKSRVVAVDANNKIVNANLKEIAGPARRTNEQLGTSDEQRWQ